MSMNLDDIRRNLRAIHGDTFGPAIADLLVLAENALNRADVQEARAVAAESLVKDLREFTREYVVTQAHHMSDSWRAWFRERFGYEEDPPYGLRLKSPWAGSGKRPR